MGAGLESVLLHMPVRVCLTAEAAVSTLAASGQRILCLQHQSAVAAEVVQLSE